MTKLCLALLALILFATPDIARGQQRSDAIAKVRPRPVEVAGPKTASGYICRIQKNDERDYLMLRLSAEENCGGQSKANVAVTGDGNKGFWSKIESTERELRALREAHYLVSVTYVREPDGIPGYPEMWDRATEWTAAPPPVVHKRPRAAAVGPEVAAAVGPEAAAATPRPKPDPVAGEAPIGKPITAMRPRPMTEEDSNVASGFICQIRKMSNALRVTLRSEGTCAGRLVVDVHFPGDGKEGFFSRLEVTERSLRTLKQLGKPISIKYVRDPDGTNRGMEFGY